ncbi:MAG: hypothetical protein J6574_03955 [Gilliamella sp.]|nr:hypothetical protein [Gilliamella sp.]
MTLKEQAQEELIREIQKVKGNEYYTYLYNHTPRMQNVITTWIIEYLFMLKSDVGIDYYMSHKFAVREKISTYLDFAREYRYKVCTLNTTLKNISDLHIESIKRFENYKLQTLKNREK